MRLQRIELENFRPFYQNGHVIDLTAEGSNSLIIIEGNNKLGKTTLFMAISWALYGKAFDRGDQVVPFWQGDSSEFLLNRRAIAEEEYKMSVRLMFTHPSGNGQDLLHDLYREWTYDGELGVDMKEDFLLTIGEEPIVSSQVQERIDDVIHRDAAKFNLFDGELLTDYEHWLKDEELRDQTVRSAIEQTVGLSVFRMGSSLEELKSRLNKKVQSEARKDKSNATQLKRLEVLNEKKDGVHGLVNERKRLSDANTRLDRDLEELAESHQKLQDWKSAQDKISEILRNVADEDAKRLRREQQLREMVTNRPQVALGLKPQELNQRLLGVVENVLDHAPHLAQSSLASGHCSLCDALLDDASRAHLQSIADGATSGEVGSAGELMNITDQMRILSTLTAAESDFQTLKTTNDAWTTAKNEARRGRKDEEDLRSAHPEKGSLAKQYDSMVALQEDKARNDTSIEAIDKEILDIDEEVEQINAKLKKFAGKNPALTKRSDAAALIVDSFEIALERFSQEALLGVQAGASAAFSVLDSEGDSTKLILDTDYSLRTEDKQGNFVATSAGGQQILTLSFLAGLNKQAAEEAPIVMDTPFGRIDENNRERILNWIKSITSKGQQQVVLLVHSGELKREDLKRWKVVPGRFYEIKKTDEYEHSVQETNM